MAIKAACPSCGASYNFGDQLAGKKVKCKKCEAVIAVPAADVGAEAVMDDRANDGERRSKKARADDRDDDMDDRDDRPSKKSSDAPKKSSSKTLFIILGVVGGVLLLCCGGSIVGFMIVANKAANELKDVAKKIEEEMKKQQKDRPAEEKVIGKLVLNQTDKLNPNDPEIAISLDGGQTRKKRGKVFNVQLTQGKTYVINMKQILGSPLDPFLVLSDSKGAFIKSDDDSGGFPNARITHTAAMTGQYRVTATSFDGNGTGDFTLTVEER